MRDSAAREYTAILEYELPRDSRRPDVIVLQRGCVAVLELQRAASVARGAGSGARLRAGLGAYHTTCAERKVISVAWH